MNKNIKDLAGSLCFSFLFISMGCEEGLLSATPPPMPNTQAGLGAVLPVAFVGSNVGKVLRGDDLDCVEMQELCIGDVCSYVGTVFHTEQCLFPIEGEFSGPIRFIGRTLSSEALVLLAADFSGTRIADRELYVPEDVVAFSIRILPESITTVYAGYGLNLGDAFQDEEACFGIDFTNETGSDGGIVLDAGAGASDAGASSVDGGTQRMDSGVVFMDGGQSTSDGGAHVDETDPLAGCQLPENLEELELAGESIADISWENETAWSDRLTLASTTNLQAMEEREEGDEEWVDGDDLTIVGVNDPLETNDTAHFRLGWATSQCRLNPISGVAQEDYPFGQIAYFDETCDGAGTVFGYENRLPFDFLR